MLDDAAFALLVLTAEDEIAEGELQPRMNVVHEAGLFQGRLGFTKAIILVEEGCKSSATPKASVRLDFPKAAFRQPLRASGEFWRGKGY